MSWLKWLRDRLRAFLRRDRSLLQMLGPRSARHAGGDCVGDWLGTILLATVLATFFVFLIVLWLRREPFAARIERGPSSNPGPAELLAQLPEEFVPGHRRPLGRSPAAAAAG